MLKLGVIASIILSTFAATSTPAIAGTESYPYSTEYGSGSNYFKICNETNESRVTFYTDETSHEHWLKQGECDVIWTNFNYIVVKYDTSWQYGDQLKEVRVSYPNDLSLVDAGQDYYGEFIGHRK